MRIVHYTYGIPPRRTGGLIKYALDMAKTQQSAGHDVTLLYPGKFSGKDYGRTSFRHTEYDGLPAVEIINPLPIPMTGGILDIEMYTMPGDRHIFERLFKEIMPDILHVHSVMGIHRELLEAAVSSGVKIVYTTHDYFGLCPTVNLFCDDKVCTKKDWNECVHCCVHAFSRKKLVRQQSDLFRIYKGSRFIEGLKKSRKLVAWTEKMKKRNADSEKKEILPNVDYQSLKLYYEEMFEMVDVFHFNSNMSRQVFEERIPVSRGIVLPIAHSAVGDFRHKKIYDYKMPLRLTYLGKPKSYKGYQLLIKALDRLYAQGFEIVLDVYFEEGQDSRPYIHYHQPYVYAQLEEVMNRADMVVVPSIWKETFGFVVLEALSYGVPVLVSRNVGAGDLVRQCSGGFIVEPEAERIYECILSVCKNRELLARANENICNAVLPLSWEDHAEELLKLYQESC
jgi:glycosyltransferase involved in cell wall biosynthesis